MALRQGHVLLLGLALLALYCGSAKADFLRYAVDDEGTGGCNLAEALAVAANPALINGCVGATVSSITDIPEIVFDTGSLGSVLHITEGLFIESSVSIRGPSSAGGLTVTFAPPTAPPTSVPLFTFIPDDEDSKLKIADLTFSAAMTLEPSTQQFAGILLADSVRQVHLTGCTFTGINVNVTNVPSNSVLSGVLSINKVDRVLMFDCSFVSNRVLAPVSTLDFSYSVAVLLLDITDLVHISDCLFDDNQVSGMFSEENGFAAIAANEAGNFTMSDTIVSNCKSFSSVVTISDSENASISDCLFQDNHSNSTGGALNIEETEGEFFCSKGPCGFIDNTSSTHGGAVALSSTATTVEFRCAEGVDCFFLGNDALENGGAVYSDFSLSFFGPWLFAFNTAQLSGGAIFSASTAAHSFDGATQWMENMAISGSGGCIHAQSAVSIQNAVSFSGNTASLGGGCIQAQGNVCVLDVAGSIVGNIVTGNGGGGFVNGVDVELTMLGTIVNSELSGNRGGPSGGGVIFATSIARLTTCLDPSCISFDIHDNAADEIGGVINAFGDAELFLGTKTDVYNNHATLTLNGPYAGQSSGGVVGAGGTVTISSGRDFSHNTAGRGGIVNADTVLVEEIRDVYENSAIQDSGGAFHADPGGVTITQVRDIYTNDAIGGGGAIYAAGSVTISDARGITGNSVMGSVSSSGGVVATPSSVVLGTIGTFSNNMASKSGGAISAGGTISAASIGTISTNMALDGSGGAFFSSDTTTIVSCGNVSGNSATVSGGALYTAGDLLFTGTGSELASNMCGSAATAQDCGGAFYSALTMTVSNIAEVFSNDALTGRGGVFYAGSSCTFCDFGHIRDNSAPDRGGMAYCEGAIMLTRAGIIEKNTAERGGSLYSPSGVTLDTVMSLTSHNVDGHFSVEGGAVWAGDGATMTDIGEISFNNATSKGGAIFVADGGLFCSVVGDIYSNSAAEGGAIHSENGITVTAANVYDNHATMGNGGAFYSDLSSLYGPFVGISHNSAAGDGGAIHCGGVLSLRGDIGNIESNFAEGNGGAFHSDGISSGGHEIGIIQSNECGSGGRVCMGGAIHSLSDATLSKVGALLSNGDHANLGGAIMAGEVDIDFPPSCSEQLSEASITIGELGTVFDNTGLSGGAIMATGNIDFTTSVGTVSLNSALGEIGGTSIGDCGFGGAFYAHGTFEADDVGTLDNNEAAFGGAIYCDTLNVATFADVTENTALAGDGGAVYIATQAMDDIISVGAVFKNRALMGDGGFLYAGDGVVIESITGEVTFNEAQHGGVFYVDSGDFDYRGVGPLVARHNKASDDGGVIYNAAGSITLDNVAEFFNNSATGRGGVVFSASGSEDMTLTNIGLVHYNKAAEGGAFYSSDSLEVTDSGSSTFTFNRALTGSGGVIYTENMLTLTGVGDFTNNDADASGGAFFTLGVATLANTGCFTNNTAVQGNGGAGAMGAGESNLDQIQCADDNTAAGEGGAFFSEGTLTVSNLGSLSGNEAESGDGGGIYATTELEVMACASAEGNMASSGHGGAFFAPSITLNEMGACTGNSADAGGVAYSIGTLNVMAMGDIVGNSATSEGGAFYAAILNLTGDTDERPDITGNTASAGGVVFVTTSAEMEGFGHVSNNKATAGNGGVLCGSGNAVTVNAQDFLSVEDNFADGDGGAFFVCGNLALTALGPLTNNTANSNGGVATAPTISYFSLVATLVFNNTAGASGGVFHSDNFGCFPLLGITVISSSTFQQNRALGGDGGALNSPFAGVSGQFNDMLGNSATEKGGAVHCGMGTCQFFSTGDWIGNSADQGGAIFSGMETVNLGDVGAVGSFIGNSATFQGGAIKAPRLVAPIGVGDVIGNTAEEGGFAKVGGLPQPNVPQVDIFSVNSFSMNTATAGNGGAIATTGDLHIRFCGEITDNTCTTTEDSCNRTDADGGGGGAIFASGLVNLTCVDSVAVQRNKAFGPCGNGGALSGADILFGSATVISHNSADRDGGAFYGNTGDVEIGMGGDVASNTALRNGGAFCSLEADVSIDTMGTAMSNSAANGGFVYGGNVILENARSLVGNTADGGEGTLSFGGAAFGTFSIDATITGTVSGNTATFGGAFCCFGDLSLSMPGMVSSNRAVGDDGAGGVGWTGGKLTVQPLGPTIDNSASAGGAFYQQSATTPSSIALTGDVSENSADLGSFLFSGCQSQCDEPFIVQVTAPGTEWRDNSVTSTNAPSAMFHTGSALSVDMSMNAVDVHHNEGGVFRTDGDLDVDAAGSLFRSNDGAIASAEGAAQVTEFGGIFSNEVGAGCMVSAAGGSLFLSVAGDVSQNRALDGLFCAAQDCSVDYSTNVTFSANRGPLMNSTGAATVLSSLVEGMKATISNNRGTGLFVARTLVRANLNGGHLQGNQAPLAEVTDGPGGVQLHVGKISDTTAPEDSQKSLFEVFGGGSLTLTVDEGICNNAGGPNADFAFAGSSSSSGALSTIDIVTGDQFGIDGTSGGAQGFVEEPSGTCSMATTRVLTPHTLPPSCEAEVTLEKPYAIFASGPPAALLAQVFNVTVTVATVSESDPPLTVVASVGDDSFSLGAIPSEETVDGVAEFALQIFSVTETAGNPSLTFSLPHLCPPLATVMPFVIVGPSRSPTGTPAALPTPSLSGTPSTSRTLLAVPTSGSVASSAVSATGVSVPTGVVVTAVPRLSFSSTVSPSPSQSLSRTRAPVSVATRPSESPLPSARRTKSPSRSPSRTPLALPTRSCLGPNCVRPTVTLLDPTITQQEVPFTDNEGRPAGTVLVPAAAIQPGEVLVVGPASEEAEVAAESLDVASEIVQVTLTDIFGANAQPSDDIEICLEVSDADRAEDNGCLSFFDEEKGAWVCEDPCLELDGNLACGTTDHFTNFAVLFGEGGGSGQCGSDDDDYILDAAWQDGLLVGGVFAAAVLICVAIVLIGILFPRAVGRLHGKEYNRIRSLRTSERTVTASSV